MLIRKAYDRSRVAFATEGPSMTKQADADGCDINKIMRRYEKTGVVEHVNRFQGDYGDFTSVQDYQTSVNQVLAAQEAFNSLPSKVRRRFDNDPASFLAFVGDEANREEMVELGLLKAPQEPAGEGGDDPVPPLPEPSPEPSPGA